MSFYSTALGILALLSSSYATANPKILLCHGSSSRGRVSVQVTETDGGQASIIVKQPQPGLEQILLADAKGESFTECGTRTVPCQLVENTQYSGENPDLILTLIGEAGGSSSTGSLTLYENGFSAPATEKVSVTCEKNEVPLNTASFDLSQEDSICDQPHCPLRYCGRCHSGNLTP